MKRVGAILVLLAASANAQTTALQLRAGESIDGFPTWSERVVLEWINRARVDPQTELANCGAACSERACYSPQPPLYWDDSLNHSARYHAAEMTKQGYFAHDSKCTIVSNINGLYPVGCDGSASCGCVGGAVACATGGCTSWDARVGMFGSAPSGEIIAGTPLPMTAYNLWMFETAASSGCGFNSGNGHRYIMLTSLGGAGIGISGNDSVGDFGGIGVAYKIPSAAHYPQQGPSIDLWANWYDSAAPRSANAVVDGVCVSMSLKRGTQQNGAWSATVTNAASGCHRYYFSFVDATGAVITWPATGSLGIGCADWDSSRLTASCTSSTTPPSASRRRSARH